MTVETLEDSYERREAQSRDLVYDGAAGALAGIALSNTLLTLATLGVYRFWGKTRLRRYLWSRVSLDGDRLEYVGTGKELFFGFCIAMAILLPIFTIPALVELFFFEHPIVYAFVQLGYVILLFWLIQVAIFRARRYRLSRTKWRAIRAGQSGSATGYALVVFGTGLLNLFTLYLAYPWVRTARQRYLVQHSWFGNVKFSFRARGSALLAPWLLVMLPIVAAVVIGVIFITVKAIPQWRQSDWAVALPPLFLLLAVVMYLRYRVVEFRYFASCTRFSRCRFRCDLRSFKVLLLLLACALLLAGAGAAITAGVVTAMGVTAEQMQKVLILFQYGGSGPAPLGEGDALLLLALLVWMVLIAAAFSLIRAAVYLHWMTRLLCASLTLTEVGEFAAVARSKAEMPRFGEGLADALDVGEIGF